ncbi:MAG: primosomal protein N' [Betaproteobacteria bacterium]|nr:primosomal protein N' [Betaproteobacteria bacterium]
MPILRVALDVPLATLFDYRADDASRADVGCRVTVPFGRQQTVIGVILEVAETTRIAAGRLKPVLRVLREEPALTDADLQLLRFAADYYHHPLGAAVMAALPARLRQPGGKRSRASGAVQAQSRGITAATPPRVHGAPPLTGEQARAVEEIRSALGAFRPMLLLGVTSSGKSEVYLHAVADALAAGRQALLLVPEIALTPQLEALVRDRFPGTAAVSLHSGLNAGERHAHWRAAQGGHARIVLGTRLAVFTPLPELGLIIVDEEHDASYKQAEGFRYSARDLAVVRARLCNVPVVLGSATPALESYSNAAGGRYRLLTLESRIGAPPPRIACLDTRAARPVDGLSEPLLAAIAECLKRGEQSLIFINRRGYAPVLRCPACGWVSACHRCSAQLVLHLKDRRLRCHHCGHQEAVPAGCPGCGNPQLAPLGQGTQRVEAALSERFPRARIARIDRDSIRRRQAWPEMRRRIHERDVDLLVGTQLLAKGHDFPHLNLVGVVNADSLLYSSDFRAGERLYALLTQVAGRAGRGGTLGSVLIQTEFPHHPLYQALQRQDYRAFADSLLAERRQAGFPPFIHQALLRAEAPRLATALDFLAEAARRARRLAAPQITLYDAVPAAMPRRAGRERAQLLVQSESRARLQEFLGAWMSELVAARATRARWSLDVDPLEF